MTNLLIAYVLAGRLVIGTALFNSFAACEAARLALEVQSQYVFAVACFTNI